METLSFPSSGGRCEAWYLRAETEELAGPHGRPCVVMGHGFAATRDAGLLPFAERFAAAGLDVLVFDYRGFGTSPGKLRQDVNHRKHRQDYHAAVAWARSMPGVDMTRIVLWGSSYSGGHVVAVAAQDAMIAAVISQGAAMDGLAALRGVQSGEGTGKAGALTVAGLRDLGRALTRRAPLMVPVVGEPGSSAVISSPGSLAGYGNIMGPSFRNEMCARGILRIAFNRPVLAAGKIDCAALYIVAEQDNVAPPSAVLEAARRTGVRAEVESYDCGHFEIYVGAVFEKSVSRQVEFLRRHVG
jgi:pimeloyl-ACP methyl ester carboxylesterase